MNFIISGFPYIDPAQYFKLKKLYDPILSNDRLILYSSGRTALYHGVKAIALPKNSTVLVPAFHCGVEVEALVRAGCSLSFYNIKKDLSIDFDALNDSVNEATKAIVIIHYFGFSQNMTKVMQFCHDKGLLLIEDCAHALYSSFRGRWLGTFGAFGAYSLRKTIGLPNGGGLLCNSPELSDPPAAKKDFGLGLLKSTVKSILEFKKNQISVCGRISSAALSLFAAMRNKVTVDLSTTRSASDGSNFDIQRRSYGKAINWLSLPLLRKESYERTINKRRENYRMLGEMLKDAHNSAKPLKGLDDGVCPLCYVVCVEKRAPVVSEMRRNGVSPFIFGTTPDPSLILRDRSDLKFLSEKLIGLPVHQQLRERDIESVAVTFLKAVKDVG